MAPIPLEPVDDQLKEVIQDLFEIGSMTVSYLGPETQQELVRKVYATSPKQRSLVAISSTDALFVVRSTHLASSLAELSKSSSTLSTQIPPEIIEYVDEGRNPDIYTREFVELVQRGNQELKAKSEAFASFRDILGEELATAMPEIQDDVSRILSGGPVVGVKMENHKVKGGQNT